MNRWKRKNIDILQGARREGLYGQLNVQHCDFKEDVDFSRTLPEDPLERKVITEPLVPTQEPPADSSVDTDLGNPCDECIDSDFIKLAGGRRFAMFNEGVWHHRKQNAVQPLASEGGLCQVSLTLNDGTPAIFYSITNDLTSGANATFQDCVDLVEPSVIAPDKWSLLYFVKANDAQGDTWPQGSFGDIYENEHTLVLCSRDLFFNNCPLDCILCDDKPVAVWGNSGHGIVCAYALDEDGTSWSHSIVNPSQTDLEFYPGSLTLIGSRLAMIVGDVSEFYYAYSDDCGASWFISDPIDTIVGNTVARVSMVNFDGRPAFIINSTSVVTDRYFASYYEASDENGTSWTREEILQCLPNGCPVLISDLMIVDEMPAIIAFGTISGGTLMYKRKESESDIFGIDAYNSYTSVPPNVGSVDDAKFLVLADDGRGYRVPAIFSLSGGSVYFSFAKDEQGDCWDTAYFGEDSQCVAISDQSSIWPLYVSGRPAVTTVDMSDTPLFIDPPQEVKYFRMWEMDEE